MTPPSTWPASSTGCSWRGSPSPRRSAGPAGRAPALPGDPTWLAYCCFADPTACLGRSSREGPAGWAFPAGAEPRLLVMRGQRHNVEYPIYEGLNFIGRADEKPVDIDLE